MQMVDMFYKELEDAKKRKVPFVIPIGTIEYHAHHASCGTDTMVINGVMRELEKTKEMVVCPPIWYGVASYAVAGPESGTIHVDVFTTGQLGMETCTYFEQGSDSSFCSNRTGSGGGYTGEKF